jgi:hypothetical protein
MTVAATPITATASSARNNIFSFFMIWRSAGNQPNNRPINITSGRVRGEQRGPMRFSGRSEIRFEAWRPAKSLTVASSGGVLGHIQGSERRPPPLRSLASCGLSR